MGLDDFSLQSNNGKKYSLNDLKDIKPEDIAQNIKLQKFIKLFDFDGSGAIENRWVNGKNEWQSIFTELKQAAVDDDLSYQEFGLYISKKLPDEDIQLEDVNELLDTASSQGNVKQIGDMAITQMNGFVAIKIKPNTTILAKNVNENGQFSDDDFIEMRTVDSEGKEITVKREEFKTKEGTTQCIVVTRQDSKDESSTTIYGTSSYYMYEIFKGEESLKAMEFYRKGNNEYYVQYTQEGNTITHAKNGDTVDSLIQKFGFKDREEFDRLNPTLKGKKYPNVADSIVVPGRYSAKDNKIVEQGTVYGEQYNYIKTVIEAERRKFKEEHLQKLDEDIFNKLNNLKGLELSNENIGLYFSLNSYPQKTQEYIFNIIEKLAKEGKTADEIKTYFLSDPNAPKLTRKDGTKVTINLFNEFSIQMHDFVGTQADDTPQSVKGFIQDVMGLDITKGEGKELYDKLSKVGDPYVIMDINEMFSNIYHRTSKEYKDWHSKQVARLNSDGWKSDKSIKTTGEREYLKEYPPISKETALEMYRAVINKMTAKKGETVTTKYDKFIEDNRDVYLREFAALTLFSLHQSGAGNLQGTAAQKDILNPSKYLLKPVGSFYDKKGKEIYETMMTDCYKGNKKFESILKCYTTGYKQAGVPFDKAKMKHCMEVLQNPKSTEAQKKKALEDAFGYSVVNAAQDLIGVANFVDNVTDMALMIYGTGLIGKGLGKAVSVASKASTATRATAVITNTAKGISWGERLTQIGLSATNFAIWEGARFTVNYYTNDIEEDFSYDSGLGQRMAGGAAFGTFAGAWGQFVTQPMLKWIFKTPTQEAVTKEATAFVQKQLKGSSKFTSKEVLGAFNAGQQKAMTSLGKEAVGFASELTGFSIYEIGQKLIIGNDSQIRQILQDSKKYKPEEIDDLLKNPDELKKALKEVGCTDDVIRELTEINVGDVALGQLKTLLSFKAVGQLVYMHRAGKLPPSALNYGKEKPLEFEPIKQNGKTMYKVTYPDGTTRTVADMNGVIALSNMHYQDVTLYKPIEQVLAKDGKMELDEGITLQKNTEGYSVTFKDGTKIEAKDLKEVMGRAQAEYTIMGYETELAQKGKVELPDKQVVTFDRENNVYKTTMEGGIEVEAPSFKELLQTVQKKTVCQSIEKTFTDDKKAVMLDESTVIVKQEDGTYRMIVIEDGFPKEYLGKSVEEVLDKSAGVNEGVTTEVQEKVTPQGMNAEEDALIQKARKENPATVIEDKVREKWQQHDLETPTAETDEPAIIFKDGKAVINEDLARRQLEEPAQVVSDEVTSLIFKGKLTEHLTQRYEEMGKVFEEIAKKRSADIKELVKQNSKNKQAVADGIVKILAQELGMEGFEPPIVFEDTNRADGYADWPNGRIVINKNITNVKKLTSMISHEFVHMLQFRDVLAQYGEQGLRDLIANDKSIPENEKESHIKKALNNPYNQHLLQSYNFQTVQEGTVEDYLRRIYKDEFTNTVGTDNMPKYVDQATEREAYNLGSEKLGENTEGLNDVNAEPSSLQERIARMRAQLQGGQDATIDEVPIQTVSTEGYEIDEYGQIHRKSVPAGIASDRMQEALSNLQNNLTTGKNISIQDLQEFFKITGNEKLISLPDYSLGSIIEKLDKDNIVILESLSSRVGNGFETYNIDYYLDMTKNNPELSTKLNYLLSIQREGKYLFDSFIDIDGLLTTAFDKELLNSMLLAKNKDEQYIYGQSYIASALQLCGNNLQKIEAMNMMVADAKKIDQFYLRDYLQYTTPENVDLILWVNTELSFDGKFLFEYCNSTEKQLPKLQEIAQRKDINRYTKESMIKSYLQAPELSEQLYRDPRYLEDSDRTWLISTHYAKNKDLIDYLVSMKNPTNPEYTKYDPRDILDIVESNLDKCDITQDFLNQLDKLKSLKSQDGEPLCGNAVKLVLLAKNKPELKPLFEIAVQEMTKEENSCINGGQLKSIMENFENIPKDYQVRLLKLVNDNDNIFNLHNLYQVCQLPTKDSYLFTKDGNPWRIDAFNDILNRLEKGEFTDIKELNCISDLVENISSPISINLYNKLMSFNTAESKRFTLKNILELIKHPYYEMDDLDYILNYKDVDGITPRFNGDEIDMDLINWVGKTWRGKFEEIANLKNSDGKYKFDGIAIKAILSNRSRIGNKDIIDKILSLETNGKAKFNGQNCKDLLDIALNRGKDFYDIILTLMENPDISPELIIGIFGYTREINPPSIDTPWEKLAKSGILTDNDGNIDELLIENIKLFWNCNAEKEERLLNKMCIGDSPNEREYTRNFNKGLINQVDWVKQVIEVAETNNLSQQETRFLWQFGKHSIYDNYHGRWSDLNTEKINNTNKFLASLLKADADININDFDTTNKLALLNYLSEVQIEDFNSDLAFSKFIRSYGSIDEVRTAIFKELEKELKLPGSNINLSKQQLGALLQGDFKNNLSEFPFINNKILLRYDSAVEKAKVNDNIDSRDVVVLKFSILLSDLASDNQQCAIIARNILEHNGLTSDVTERVFNIIRNRNWFDAYKQGTLDIEDIAVLFREPNDFELAKIISGKDFSSGENKEISDQVEATLDKIYSTAPIVKPTKVPYEQRKFERVEFEGDEYKIVDFTNPNLDLEALGFPKGLSIEQIRFLTHFMKITNKDAVNSRLSASSPELINILCDEVNNTSLSAALIDPLHIDVDVMGRNCAVVIEPMSSNYAAAYHEDFTSPLKKGYSEFKDYLMGKLTPEQREYTANVYKKYLGLSDSEYVQFYKALSKLDDVSRIKTDIVINKDTPNQRIISAQEITEAIEYVNNSLSNITKNWNELIIYNPKIKALLYKIETPVQNNLLENCPIEVLNFARKYDLPIIIVK